jgi:TM2 domain-containing membrane protein YozV
MKNKSTAYILWCLGFVGLCGIHRFYMGKIGTGIIWLFTFGLFGFGQLLDLFLISEQVDTINTRKNINKLTNITLANAIEKGEK